MTLIENMTALNARLTSIPIRFGVPQHRNLLVRHVGHDETLLPIDTDTLLEPLPHISNVPTKLVGYELGKNIELRQDDFVAANIPRTYTREFLENGVEFYVIDPGLDNGAVLYDSEGRPLSGIFCKCIHISDKDLLTWKLTLRKLDDHYVPDTAEVNW